MPVPSFYQRMADEHPDLVKAYEAFGKACRDAGPLDEQTLALVKLAISLGAGLEGAAHAHTRKALKAGCTPQQCLHVAHLCAPTVGFPTMMRARSWVLDVLDDNA